MSRESRGSRDPNLSNLAQDLQRCDELIEKVSTELRSRGETIGFAESCTGGLLSGCFTDLAGVSDVYMGSVIAYSNRLKEKLLGVSTSTLMASGAVSPQTAGEMARGACSVLEVEWAVSITGIAGPGGGTPQKPVGTVCFGLAGPGVEETAAQLFSGDRRAIREAAVRFALEMLWRNLTGP
jgi:PncC family amidohydrolase